MIANEHDDVPMSSGPVPSHSRGDPEVSMSLCIPRLVSSAAQSAGGRKSSGNGAISSPSRDPRGVDVGGFGGAGRRCWQF